MIKPNKIEIMSPVGSYESHAAIQGGANSVYFGGQAQYAFPFQCEFYNRRFARNC